MCLNTLSLVPFAGMTLNKCAVLWFETSTGCPLCKEIHPLCSLKIPTVIKIWLLVGFHLGTWSVQSKSLPLMPMRASGSILNYKRNPSDTFKGNYGKMIKKSKYILYHII